MWTAIIIIAIIISLLLDSALGKLITGAGVLALGLLIISWITGFVFLITLAKACAVIIVIANVGTILLALMGG